MTRTQHLAFAARPSAFMHRARPILTRLLIALLPIWLAACGGPPKKTLTEAESALADAKMAEKCAPEDYAAARRMLDKANEQSKAGKFEEAEQSARAARKLAEKARKKAILNKEECEKKDANPDEINVADYVDQTANPDDQIQVGDDAELKTIYFDYNAFELTSEARKTLAHNAAVLSNHGELKIVVEGHCDRRGSSEYNLALGEKRSRVVAKYLKTLGVDVDRMALLSYGEENPMDFGDSETAHARNRRVEFTVRQ